MDGDHGISDQNYLVWNQGKNPLVNFNFMLRVELVFDLPCKSVRAFSRELEYDFIQEGGLNDYVHMRRKPITHPFTLEIERYVGVDYVDPLPLGAELALPVLLFVSRVHDQFIPFVVARTYTFTGCSVIKKTYGDLVADQSGLLVETTTLAYREMMCVDIPWSEVGDSIVGPPLKSKEASTAMIPQSNLKELGNECLKKAQAYNEKAKKDYVEKDVDDVINQVNTSIGDLNTALSVGGSIYEGKQKAQDGLKNKDGKSLEEIAKELQDGLPGIRQTMDDSKESMHNAYSTLKEKEKSYLTAQSELRKAENALEKANNEKSEKKQDDLPSTDETAETEKTVTTKDTEQKDQTEKTDAKDPYDTEKENYTQAVEDYEEALKKYYTDRDAYDAAREAASAASAADSAAKMRVNIAERVVQKGTKRKNELQNTLTNLNARKKICAQAQIDCGNAYNKCETENTKLQGIDDAQINEQNAAYLEVKNASKNTNALQRKTSEIKKYLGIAKKIIEDTNTLIKTPAE